MTICYNQYAKGWLAGINSERIIIHSSPQPPVFSSDKNHCALRAPDRQSWRQSKIFPSRVGGNQSRAKRE